MMALSAPSLPQAAIDLMVRRPIEELSERRAVWLPIRRFASKDAFLTDLRAGHERRVFPVYFERLPASDDVVDCGGTQISIPSAVFSGNRASMADKWRRAMLKLTKLPNDQAQVALIDLPEVFADTSGDESNSTKIEIRLFEFIEIDRRVFHPAILIREE